jgi:hypothetical protein
MVKLLAFYQNIMTLLDIAIFYSSSVIPLFEQSPLNDVFSVMLVCAGVTIFRKILSELGR